MTDIIPLPDHLKNCGCPRAETGTHLTSCIPAKIYDASPLADRPGYVDGARFRSITWDYPFRLNATLRVTVELDPFSYIKRHIGAYEAFALEPGYEEWEKPIAFLLSRLEEDAAVDSFGWPRSESRVDSWWDDMGSSDWTPEMTEELHKRLYKSPPEIQGQESLL